MPPEYKTYLPGIPAYIVLSNSDGDCFRNDDDYQYCLDVLGQGCARFDVQLHAYCLMNDCAHLLLTQEQERFGIDDVLRFLDRQYGIWLRSAGGPNTLWNGKHQACLIDADSYLLSCYRYIEQAPVVAGLVARPEQYRWSSYTNHALGQRNSRISDHYLYLALGRNPQVRQRAYAEFFHSPIAGTELNQIHESLVFGQPLGDMRFRTRIKKAQEKRSGRNRYSHGKIARDREPGFIRN